MNTELTVNQRNALDDARCYFDDKLKNIRVTNLGAWQVESGCWHPTASISFLFDGRPATARFPSLPGYPPTVTFDNMFSRFGSRMICPL